MIESIFNLKIIMYGLIIISVHDLPYDCILPLGLLRLCSTCDQCMKLHPQINMFTFHKGM